MKIRVDIREDEQLIQQIRYEAPSLDIEVEVVQLEVGDYAAGISDDGTKGKLGIEYKAHDDFLGSLGERLFTQAHELAANYEIPVVLVGSDLNSLCSSGRHSEEAIRGFVASLTVREGVSVLFVGPNPVSMILRLALKAMTKSNRVYNPIRRGGTKQEFGVGLIAALPGMGMKRAKLVLDKFGTPLDALTRVPEWAEIPGIGAKSVEKVLGILCAEGSSQDAVSEINPLEEEHV